MTEPIREWRRTRLQATRFAPLAILMTALAVAAARPDAATVVSTLFLAGLLLAGFRLADDLADRGRDTREHPERILTQTDAAGLTRMHRFGMLLAVTAMVLLATGRFPGRALAGMVALATLLAGWYRLRPADSQVSDAIGAHIVLVKYPVCTQLLALHAGASSIGGGLPALALVYLSFTLDEILDDPRLRAAPFARALAAAEVIGWVAAALWIARAHPTDGAAPTVGIVIGSALLIAVVVATLAVPVSPGPRWPRHAPLLVGFSQLLTLQLWRIVL